VAARHPIQAAASLLPRAALDPARWGPTTRPALAQQLQTHSHDSSPFSKQPARPLFVPWWTPASPWRPRRVPGRGTPAARPCGRPRCACCGGGWGLDRAARAVHRGGARVACGSGARRARLRAATTASGTPPRSESNLAPAAGDRGPPAAPRRRPPRTRCLRTRTSTTCARRRATRPTSASRWGPVQGSRWARGRGLGALCLPRFACCPPPPPMPCCPHRPLRSAPQYTPFCPHAPTCGKECRAPRWAWRPKAR
jgi:hypothetical protein